MPRNPKSNRASFEARIDFPSSYSPIKPASVSTALRLGAFLALLPGRVLEHIRVHVARGQLHVPHYLGAPKHTRRGTQQQIRNIKKEHKIQRQMSNPRNNSSTRGLERKGEKERKRASVRVLSTLEARERDAWLGYKLTEPRMKQLLMAWSCGKRSASTT